MTLPDLYLVGAPKAGTTSIASWLAAHPDVFWSTPKEPFFWASDYPRMREHYGFPSLSDYRSLFDSEAARNARVRGEGSTTYLHSTRAVADIIKQVPAARFVVCLRRPADLLVSYHRTQLVALNEDEPSFSAAWHRSLAGGLPATDPLDAKLVDYPMVGALGAAVARLLDVAARDAVHFVLFDDLVADPAAVWKALAGFVDIDAAARPELVAQNKSDKTYRSLALRRLVHRPPRALQRPVAALRQWSRTTSVPGVTSLKRLAWRSADQPDGSSDLDGVTAHYRDDVALLAGLIGRNLDAWTVGGTVSHSVDDSLG